MTTATVSLWGTTVGYISMRKNEHHARFEYDPNFVELGIELAPVVMPIKAHHIYQFSNLPIRSFYGLPGLLADSLPDKYGNKLINVWLAQTGRLQEDFNAVDRLCYTGTRAMGALEFQPVTQSPVTTDKELQIKELVELASIAFTDKTTLDTKLSSNNGEQALFDMLSIGTSAGGARAKAVIAFNPTTKQVHSGQINLSAGFEHWLIKFDGVKFNGDWGVADPSGYGLLEYSYYLMAKRCGIDMMHCKLFSENNRHHFMTKRFDREDNGSKKFVQTFAAINHFDYWESGLYSYEQLFMTMKQLSMSQTDIEQQFLRTLFNLVSCNQDDHVKNTSFIMDRKGAWSLSPAYDLCHAEGSAYTRSHQLSINSKTNHFTLADIKHLADYVGLPRGREKILLENVIDTFSKWSALADELQIPSTLKQHVLSTLRLHWK